MECRKPQFKGFDDLPIGLFEYIVDFLAHSPPLIFKLRRLNKKYKQRIHGYWRNKYQRVLMEITALRSRKEELSQGEDFEVYQELREELDGARGNIQVLTRQDINELKVYNKPFADVALAVGLVAILFDEVKAQSDLEWPKLQATILRKPPGLTRRMKEFKFENLSEKTVRRARGFIRRNQAHMGYQHILLTSPAAANMYRWAQSTLDWYDVQNKTLDVPMFLLNNTIQERLNFVKKIKKWSSLFIFSLK